MNLFRKRASDQTVVGVQFNADGVALTHVAAHRQPPQGLSADAVRTTSELLHSEWLPSEASRVQTRLLDERVERLGLKRKPCHLVLGRDDYNLLLIEAPAVPASELREAVRWRIRDLIDFPVEQAVVDAFLLPEDRSRGGKRMAYVAVARRELIQERIAQVEASHLNLQSIDIPELAIRNLTLQVCDTSRGVALARLGQGSGSLFIVRGEDLHLARRFKLPYEGGLLEDLPADVLVLEVQRSLDYFERQMRQPPPGQIYLVGENVSDDKLTDVIRDGLPLPVALFEMEAGFNLDESVQDYALPLCMDALGAALRQSSGKGL